eukprot:1196119-Prorocentrum_minimum.AAC.6
MLVPVAGQYSENTLNIRVIPSIILWKAPHSSLPTYTSVGDMRHEHDPHNNSTTARNALAPVKHVITINPIYLRPKPLAGGCAPFFPVFLFPFFFRLPSAPAAAIASTRLRLAGSGAAGDGAGSLAGNPRATHCCVTHFSSTAASAWCSVLPRPNTRAY